MFDRTLRGMGTWKTYLQIENNTVWDVTSAVVTFPVDFTENVIANDFPSTLLTTIDSDTRFKKDGVQYRKVTGPLAIGRSASMACVLQLFTECPNDAFNLTLVFEDKKYLAVDVYQRQAYTTSDPVGVPLTGNNTQGTTDAFAVRQSGDKDAPPNVDSYGCNTLSLQQAPVPVPYAEWLGLLPDDRLLCDINLPGSHDSAAINPDRHTAASTQELSIPQQLVAGVRLLDVRLKVMGGPGTYWFMTCHGEVQPNEFEPFTQLLDECRTFLQLHPTETIVMSLKIDDWNGNDANPQEKQDVRDAIATVVGAYPIWPQTNTNGKADLPKLGDARSHIYLVNRIDDELHLGAPLDIDDNTTGQVTSMRYRNFELYVQDHYDFYNNTDKQDCITEKWGDFYNAFAQKVDGLTVVNFGSAVRTQTLHGLRLWGVYIDETMLTWFGQATAGGTRPRKLGWALMDYVTEPHKISVAPYFLNFTMLWVSSNFGYEDIPSQYHLV